MNLEYIQHPQIMYYFIIWDTENSENTYSYSRQSVFKSEPSFEVPPSICINTILLAPIDYQMVFVPSLSIEWCI